MAKKNELMKFMAEAQQEAETLAKLTPGSDDSKKHEDRITQLKAQLEAGREQAEREFTLREAEMIATLYNEIQTMVGRIAKYRGFAYVVRVSNDPITGANPNSAMAAIERTVVYADPRNDITNDVIYNLNREYKASGGTVPKGPPTAPAPAGRRPLPRRRTAGPRRAATDVATTGLLDRASGRTHSIGLGLGADRCVSASGSRTMRVLRGSRISDNRQG